MEGITRREMVKKSGAGVVGGFGLSSTGAPWWESDVEIKGFAIPDLAVEVYDGEEGIISFGLKNNTDEVQRVYIDFSPFLRVCAPGTKHSCSSGEYTADLTDDAVWGTYAQLDPEQEVWPSYSWVPHNAMKAHAGPYGIRIEIRSDRDGKTHDVEHQDWAFRILEADDCHEPFYEENLRFYVNREGNDC
jgi:hypothetical protein